MTLSNPAAPSASPAATAEPITFLTYGEAMALFVADTPGDLARVERFTRRVAGADLNVATGLARLGFRVGYLSRVGGDAFGRMIVDALAAEGIDTRHVSIDDRWPTGFQLKARATGGADPSVESFRRGSAASHLSVADFDAAYADEATHLHLTGVAPAISASSLELAHRLAAHFLAAGKTVSFDPNLRPALWPSTEVMVDKVNALAALATWVLPGLAEGRILTGASDPEGIAAFYLARGVRGVVVKLGVEGAYYASADGERGYVAAVPVAEVIDTVGAGDGFAVGVVSALHEGFSLARASARGALIGALAVQVIGDSEGLPSRAQLARLEASAASGLAVRAAIGDPHVAP
ncbi:sugar kinase [Robbsia sp. Bb-Pol-6]|uniref:Sugar kinase n=1 Tax=Robbsia betulipollinis TaxID=2981849 RepID=A0ABT3ZSJ0_9BURK|nr:sugar kinase [Robbsia betulipollinis]MCY0389536.1 sugar kinase [Robbsia betulipollinis]